MRVSLVIATLLACASADAAPSRGGFSGRVVDPEGRPVQVVRVLTTCDFYDDDNKGVAERFPAYSRVQADGSFTLDYTEHPRRGVKMLRYRFVASADGYSSSDELVVEESAARTPLVLRLRPAVAIRVVVVEDRTRAPLAGATVIGCATSEAPDRQARTGVDGAAVLSPCDDRQYSDPILAQAPGHADGGMNPDPKQKTQTIALAKLHRVHVRVVDRDSGQPLVGCRLARREDRFTTDARGEIVLDAPLDSLWLEPACEGYGADLDHVPQVAIVSDQQTPVLRLRHNFTIDGRLVDAAHHPVAGITVSARPLHEISTARPAALATSTTSADGRFRFSTFSADAFRVSIEDRTGRYISDSVEVVYAKLHGPIELVARTAR